jgi:hypothetical protein
MTRLNRQLLSFRLPHRLISLTLCFSLLMSTAALARFRPTPTAPRGPIPPMGTRGCSTQTNLDFAALAPISTIADLTLDHAMVAWYVPDRDAYQMTFTLYQDIAPGAAKPKWKRISQKKLVSQEEVMKEQLPTELLKEGQTYLWQAALHCVPGYPSSDLVAEAQFRVVPLPAELKQQLSQTRDLKARTQLYASAGLWYSAFTEAYPSPSAKSELLKDLVEYEQTQKALDDRSSERVRKHSESISKIAEVLSKP